MPPQIKICGLRDQAAIEAAFDAGASHIGLVHYAPSPRHVTLDEAQALRRFAGRHGQVVLLLVNASAEETQEALRAVQPDVVQFHGSETPEWLALVKRVTRLEIWKALGVKDAETLGRSARYRGIADRLLFDAPAQALPGGTGTRFDWSLIQHRPQGIDWGLAGGLNPANVAEAIKATGAPLVDTSSGVESAPGVKDMDKIRAFCQAALHHE